MNDEALIRLSNLKALNLAPKDLADRVGNRVSYWSDLLRGKKSFGEKLARKIEEQLGIPRMSLDTADPDEPIPTPQPDGTRPEADQLADALQVLTRALRKADKNTRIALEPLLASMAKEPEDAGQKSQLILTLLVTKNDRGEGSHHDHPGHISGELGSLDLGGGQDGQRDRVAAEGGSKK
jgi:hypothetical protein